LSARIGFDVSQATSEAAGCGYFARSLCENLLASDKDSQFTLFQDFGDFWFNAHKSKCSKFSGSKVSLGPVFKQGQICAKYWNDPALDQKLGDLDIIHSNNFWCPEQLIRPRLIYTLYDLGFLDHPEWTTEENRYGCFEGVYRSSLYADFVVCISEFSRKRYLEYFPHFPRERIGVVYPTSRFENVTDHGSRPAALEGIRDKGFWLCVSTIEPRKNQLMLLDAYKLYLEESEAKLPIIFAGGKGWLMDDFVVKIRKRGLEEKVILAGYVSDQELVWLYQKCFGNLYPAIYEGFGLPVLEGMQFSAPTACSNTTSLPEVAGEGGAQFDPIDERSWTEFMLKLENEPDYRLKVSHSGPIQAEKFTSLKSARECLKFYEKVLTMEKRSKLAVV
jgi:glycosyltransferase involved in cell wall biosynthesis